MNRRLWGACVALALLSPRVLHAQPGPAASIEAPKLVHMQDAVYPEARKDLVRARVVVKLDIGPDGLVRQASIHEGAGDDFDAAALTAARALTFEPAKRAGQPVAARILFTYTFDPPEPPPTPPEVPPTPPPADPNPGPGPDAGKPPLQVEEVNVRAVRPRREAQAVLIEVGEARAQAGTQGDAIRVVENVPGLARASFGSGALIAWGSAPRDTRVYVDGVEIPSLFHGAAVRSTVNADLIRSVEVVPGAYGADYGRGLGGLVRLTTKALPKDGLRGYAAIDTFDASALVATPLSSNVKLAAGLRYGYVDRLGSLVLPTATQEFFVLPRYNDYQAKLSVDVDSRRSLDVVWLGSADSAVRNIPSGDPAQKRSQTLENGFQRVYATYRYEGEGERGFVTPYVGWDTRSDTARFGAVPEELEVKGARYGVRAEYTNRLHDWVDVTVGVDSAGALNEARRFGTINRPPREGDVYAFGQPPGDEIASDDFHTHMLEAAPFVHADAHLGAFTVTPGVRAAALLIDTDRKTPRVGATPGVGQSRLEGAIDGRLAVRYDATKALAFTGAAGTYHQPPEASDLSPVFGTPGLSYQSGRQASLGAAYDLRDTSRAEITGFYKGMQDLVVRSRLATPILARALIPDGVGRSYGAQVLLRQKAWRGFSGWVSYLYSRSERKYAGDEAWFRFDYDQPHVLTAVLNKEVGAWTFGARFRLASGNPRTPVFGSYFDARGDQFQPIFGQQNTDRLPRFQQLDLRVERSFDLGQETKLLAYADFQNVLFRKNAEEFVYNFDYSQRSELSGLPPLAIVGVRVSR